MPEKQTAEPEPLGRESEPEPAEEPRQEVAAKEPEEEMVEEEPASGREDDIYSYFEEEEPLYPPSVDEPLYAYARPQGQQGGGGGGGSGVSNDGPEVQPVVYGPIIVRAAATQASAGGGEEEESVTVVAPQPTDTLSGEVEAFEWLGRLRGPWDSGVSLPVVIDVLSGPYASKSFEMGMIQIGHQVGGSGVLGNCQMIGMRQDFTSPLFAPVTAGARFRQVSSTVFRHLMGGMSAAADAYTQYLQARAQPVAPIIPLNSLGSDAIDPITGLPTGATQTVVVRQEIPEPELGRVAIGGVAQSVARSIPAQPDIRVRLEGGYVIGLAAVCQKE